MTNRYPLVVNATTNQIIEIQSGDDLLLDNTDLTTSSGDLILDPAGDVDIKADLKNTVDPNLKIDDDLHVTGTVGIGVAPIGNSDITINRTWNNSATTFFGTNIDITNNNSNVNSRLLRLATGGVTKFDVDVDGDTNIYGTSTLHGDVTFVSNAFFGDNDKINFGSSNDLEIYHNTENYIDATNGNLFIRTTGGGGVNRDMYIRSNNDVYLQSGGSSPGIKLNNGGATEIHHGGGSGKKLETLTTGISVTGNGSFSGNLTVNGNSTLGDATSDDCAINARVTTSVVPKTDSSSDLGTTALRWKDLFVDDIVVTTGISVSTLKALDNTTALTLANTTGDVTVAGDLTVTGNDIKSSSGTPITLSGNDVTINGNLTVDGTQTIINTSTLSVEDATIELRRGNNLTAATGGIQVNQTTNGSGTVTAYQQLVYDSSATKWRTYDGSTYKSLVNETDATTLGKITLNGGVVENFDDASAVGSGGIVTLDQDSSNIHVHTNPGGDFSFRVTNMPTTNQYVLSILCVVKQGATPGQPTSFYIDGADVSSLALGLSNFGKGSNGQTDVYSFQCFRQAGAWHVLANRTNFQ